MAPGDSGAIVASVMHHVSVIVEDGEASSRSLNETLGIGPWETRRITFDYLDSGDADEAEIKVMRAKFGPTLLELIQPIKGDTIWARSLRCEVDANRLHHVAFHAAEWADLYARLQQGRGQILARGIEQGKNWCYFRSEPSGLVIEFYE